MYLVQNVSLPSLQNYPTWLFLTVIQSKVAPFKNVFSPSGCDHERGVKILEI